MWVPARSLNGARWRTSSRTSGGQSNCVELACGTNSMAVRDSKNPSGPALLLGSGEWSTLLSSVKSGLLDH